jgi:hypothetical protein
MSNQFPFASGQPDSSAVPDSPIFKHERHVAGLDGSYQAYHYQLVTQITGFTSSTYLKPSWKGSEVGTISQKTSTQLTLQLGPCCPTAFLVKPAIFSF